MGGGTIDLFHGTKGAKSEYQYSLYPDDELHKKPHRIICKTATEGASAGVSHKPVHQQLISVEMVLRKCQDYRDGKLTASQLVSWLTRISSRLDMQTELQVAILDILNELRKSRSGSESYNTMEFNLILSKFESELRSLL